MRLGLISDLHADAAALGRALDTLERRGADRVVCMGDIVEKGDDGDRVVEALQWNAVAAVRGNHDEAAVACARDEGGGGLRDDTVAWLDALPATRAWQWDGARVSIAHGSPWRVDEYVFEDAVPKKMRRALRSFECDVLVLGHTHRPMVVRVGALWIVNPGSVACGRTRDSHTCAIVELPSCEVRFYDLDDGSEREVPTRVVGARGEGEAG